MNQKIIKKGIYKGFAYAITQYRSSEMEWYCGYVEVKRKDFSIYQNIKTKCGITYNGSKFDENIEFIGFHTLDFKQYNNIAFVENECMDIINQLIECGRKADEVWEKTDIQ